MIAEKASPTNEDNNSTSGPAVCLPSLTGRYELASGAYAEVVLSGDLGTPVGVEPPVVVGKYFCQGAIPGR